MRPGTALLALTGLWLVGAIVLVVLRLSDIEGASGQWLWWSAGALLFTVALVDALRPGPLRRIGVDRQLPGTLALGVATPVALTISNPLRRPLTLLVAEAPAAGLSIEGLPVTIKLLPDTERSFQYHLTPVRRGDSQLQALVVRVDSRWHLWQFRIRLGEPMALKVFPNFTPIAYFADMGMEQRLRQMGINQVLARGEGLEFKQLREFVEGDALRQVDWKASARRRKPISREYQDERDQDIFFLVDCGRRLRHRDDDLLSHFDHALNTVLLTAYIALRQGDAVGLCSFAGSERWLNPVKGKAAISILLNTVYNLQSTSLNSDFVDVAEAFANRRRKRALVVIVSDIREEDAGDLLTATRMLGQQHVVMVASLREEIIDQLIERPVREFEQALAYASAHRYASERARVIRRLRANGVVVVDSAPQQLHVQLANEYLRLKRSHRL